MTYQVKFKKLHPDAVIPSYAHPGDAGMDLYAVEDAAVEFGGVTILRTGLAVELPPHTEMQIRPKSGLASKYGITVVNSPGTIDQGYRGEILVVLTMHDVDLRYDFKKGDKIAQAVIKEVPHVIIKEVEEFTSEQTSRGEGGFGSTGK